jgi:hypothetical protein
VTPRSWTHDGVRYQITPTGAPQPAPGPAVELKRPDTGDTRWRPELHPRDRLGRFIEIGDTVRIGHGGATGRVVRTIDANRVEVQRPNGRTTVVNRSQLAVTAKNPDSREPAPRRPGSVAPRRSPAAAPEPDAAAPPPRGAPARRTRAAKPRAPRATGRVARADTRTRGMLNAAADRVESTNPGHARQLREIAADPSLLASPDGNLVAVKQGSRWRVLHAPSGRWISVYGARSRQEIPDYFDRLAKLRDEDGHPYDWGAPDLTRRAGGFVSRIIDLEEEVARAHGRKPDTDPALIERRERERRESEFRDARLQAAGRAGYVAAQARDVQPGDQVEHITTVRWRNGDLYTADGAFIGHGGITRDQVPDGSVISIRGTVTGLEESYVSDSDRRMGRTPDQFLRLGDGARWTSAAGAAGDMRSAQIDARHGLAPLLHRSHGGRSGDEAAWEADKDAAARQSGHRPRAVSGLQPGDHIVLTGRVARSPGGRMVMPGGVDAAGTGLSEGDLVEVQATLADKDWAGHRATGITWSTPDGRGGSAPDSSLLPFAKGERVMMRRGDAPAPPPNGDFPDPEREQHPRIKPGISRSQRDAIMDAGIEADPSYDDDARAAARRVREREAMTAQEMRALAGALRSAADNTDIKASRAKALHRTADRLEVSAGHLGGEDVSPDQFGDRVVEKVTPGDLTEGDTIAVPGPDGKITTRTVTGLGVPHDRFTPVHLADADGAVERRLIPNDATVYRLPDLPDDKPLPPDRTGAEHITPDRVQVGDRIRAGGRNGYAAGTEVEVVSIDRYADGSGEALVRAGSGQVAVTETLLWDGEDPAAPTVVRVARGAASADQPWDMVLPDDDPRPVNPTELRLGERIRLESQALGDSEAVGTVVELGPPLVEGREGRKVTLRMDNGATRAISLYDNDPSGPRAVHLADPDDNLAARLLQQRRQRDQRRHTELIANDLASLAEAIYNGDGWRGLGVGLSADEIATKINAESIASLLAARGDAHDMAARLGVPTSDAAGREAVAARIRPVLEEIGQSVRDNIIRAVREASPLPGENEDGARQRALRQLRDNPPVDRDTFASVARSLAELRQNLLDDAGLDRPDGSAFELPDPDGEGDLGQRIERYRQALGGGDRMGMRRVQRSSFAPTTLEDLDNGVVPAVESVEAWVPDRAADGGPGEHAMAQLELLRLAGRDTDAELQRRIASRMRDDTDMDALDAEVRRLRAESSAATQAAIDAAAQARREFAIQHGYGSWQKLVDDYRAHRTDPAEARRLQDLFDRGTAQGNRALNASMDLAAAAGLAYTKASERRAKARVREGDARRAAALELLGELLNSGVGEVHMDWYARDGRQLTERGELVKAMRFAERSYPNSWLRRFKAHAESRGQKWRIGKIRRGHYRDSDKTINLSDGIVKTTEGGKLGDVAVHEMGHGMEQAVPGLLAAQLAMLWSRTSRGKVGERDRDRKKVIYAGTNEAGYEDQFPEHYTGKDYLVNGEPVAFELFTTAIESLMGGSGYLDDDLRQWLLGTLLLLDPGGEST